MAKNYQRVNLDKDSITYPEEVMISRLIVEHMRGNNMGEYNLKSNLLDFDTIWIDDAGVICFTLADMAIAYYTTSPSNLVVLACLYQALMDTFNETE